MQNTVHPNTPLLRRLFFIAMIGLLLTAAAAWLRPVARAVVAYRAAERTEAAA